MKLCHSKTASPLGSGAAWACVLALLIFLPGCEKKASFTPPPPKVTVAQPIRHDVTEHLEITGNTQAVNTVQLRARVEGYLDKVSFRDGDVVKKDQPLFTIQQDTYVARLKQAEGNLLTQKALLDHAQIEYARYTTLFAQKAAPQTDLENWRYQKDSAQAAVTTAEAQRDLAKLDLGYTTVTAPFAGRIDRRLVDPGNLVGSGTATVLAEITQTDPLYVYFNVSETAIRPLLDRTVPKQGKDKPKPQPFFMGLASEPGHPHQGTLDFSATTVNTTTGTVLFRGVVANPDGQMLPGQFARIRIPVGIQRDALLVPKIAVAYDQIGPYVLVVDANNVVERRSVRTGPAKDSFFAIEEGLKGDEWVVVKGLLKAIPGRQVSPERQTVTFENAEGGTGGDPAGGAGAAKPDSPAGAPKPGETPKPGEKPAAPKSGASLSIRDSLRG